MGERAERRYDTVDTLVRTPGGHISTRLTVPREGPSGGPDGAVLFIQGLTTETVLFEEGATAPTALLLDGLARLGLRSLVADKRGTGKSSGAAAETDFETEVDDYARVMEELLMSPRVDQDRIYVVGHSVGALVAALLSRRFPVAGIAGIGACGLRWYECLERGTVRHMQLRGAGQEEIAHWLQLDRAAFRAPLFESRPHAFHEQLDRYEPSAVWSEARGRALVIHGSYDWVVGADEQAIVMDALARRGHRQGRFVTLDGVDHAFTRHGSLEESFERYGRGPFASRIVDELALWLAEPT